MAGAFALSINRTRPPADHRRGQPPAAVGGQHRDARDPGAPQAAPAGHRDLEAEDSGGGHDLAAVEGRQGAVELGDQARQLQLLVARAVGAEGAPERPAVGGQLLRPDRPDLQLERSSAGQRWTRASARQGLPEPSSSLSGATISTAPVGGSDLRLASWVSPYLSAPRRKEWRREGGVRDGAG